MNPSNIDPKSISLWEMKNKIKSREHFYALLSKIYRLPALSSKALFVEYMKEYLKNIDQSSELREVTLILLVIHVLAREVFEAIERLLKASNKPPLGTNILHIPDFEWLTGVYFFRTPTENEKLFQKV